MERCLLWCLFLTWREERTTMIARPSQWIKSSGRTVEETVSSLTQDTSCLHSSFYGNPWGGVLWSVVSNACGSSGSLKHIRCDVIRYKSSDQSWSSKPLYESCCPIYYSCPIHFLWIVNEKSPGVSIIWRNKVMRYHAAMSNRKATSWLGR